MTEIMSLLGAFVGTVGTGDAAGTGMLGIWQAVIDFITASGNEICLLGILAWLFVMGVGSIRRMVTGV